MTTDSAVIIKRLKDDIKGAFEEVRAALTVREKLLLRQVDVIASQCHKQNHLTEEIKFIPNEEIDIMESIRSFGKFNLPHLNFAQDLYVSEDYICPDVDHETMYKCLNTKDEVDTSSGLMAVDEPHDQYQDLANDVFDERILRENLGGVTESIVHITLKEAKDIIGKAVKISDRNEGDIEGETVDPDNKLVFQKLEKSVASNRVAQSSQTEQASSINCKKPNITINNCNGIINLKNISNLTINCTGQTSIQTAQKTNTNNSTAADECSGSDVVSSTIESDEENNHQTSKDDDNNPVNCEFYNRLLKEIKNTLKNHQNSQKHTTDQMGNNLCSSSSTESNGNESYNRKLLLKNFENLKIVLENNENDTHPVQIEQWLTEIISETEIEPMQNTGILEHSKFSGKNLC